MPRGDLLSLEMYLYRTWVRPGIENLGTCVREPSVGSQYAVKHECNNAIPLSPPFTMRGERKVPLAGGRIYMGCLVNQESRVIGHEVYREKMGEKRG